MSWVREAGYQGSPARSCEMTSPVPASKTSVGPPSAEGAVKMSAKQTAMAFRHKAAKGSILMTSPSLLPVFGTYPKFARRSTGKRLAELRHFESCGQEPIGQGPALFRTERKKGRADEAETLAPAEPGHGLLEGGNNHVAFEDVACGAERPLPAFGARLLGAGPGLRDRGG